MGPQVCLYGPIVIRQSQYLNQGAILLKALGGHLCPLGTYLVLSSMISLINFGHYDFFGFFFWNQMNFYIDSWQ